MQNDILAVQIEEISNCFYKFFTCLNRKEQNQYKISTYLYTFIHLFFLELSTFIESYKTIRIFTKRYFSCNQLRRFDWKKQRKQKMCESSNICTWQYKYVRSEQVYTNSIQKKIALNKEERICADSLYKSVQTICTDLHKLIERYLFD